MHRSSLRKRALMPRTGFSRDCRGAGILVRRACRTGPVILAAKLIAGHGAEGSGGTRPGRPGAAGLEDGLRDGGDAGREPRRPHAIRGRGKDTSQEHPAGRGSGRWPVPPERRGGVGRERSWSPGRRKMRLPGGVPRPRPSITLGDKGKRGERAHCRRSGAVQAGWCFTLTPHRTRCSVVATSLRERSRSLTRCLRWVLSLRPVREPAAGPHRQQAARLVAVPDRDGESLARGAQAALSAPTCTPARNSSRSAALIATRMTASCQGGTGSCGPPGCCLRAPEVPAQVRTTRKGGQDPGLSASAGAPLKGIWLFPSGPGSPGLC